MKVGDTFCQASGGKSRCWFLLKVIAEVGFKTYIRGKKKTSNLNLERKDGQDEL